MKNTGTEILNQIMNRWAAEFRAAQTTQVLNDQTIDMGMFSLLADERAVLMELNTVNSAEVFELA